MRGIALDDGDEVRDQVVAALQFCFHVAPRFTEVIAQANEGIVLHADVKGWQQDGGGHNEGNRVHDLANKYSGKRERISINRCKLNSMRLTGNCGSKASNSTGPWISTCKPGFASR